MHVECFMFILWNVFRIVHNFHEVYMEYHFIDLKLSWSDARQYCREHYTDLATVTNMEELDRLKTPSTFTGHSWIGLFDDPASWKKVMGNDSNSWRWSATGTTSPGTFQKWYPDAPNYNGATSQCVHISGGLWADALCEHPLPFACFTGSPHTGSKQFTLVSSQKSWADAQSYCRQHHTDLAMIEDEAEFNTVASFRQNTHVWIGLYREPWRWSDGRASRFTNWADNQPDNHQLKQHCVRVNTSNQWDDAGCHGLNSFYCEKAVERKEIHVVKMKFQAAAELSDHAISTLKQIQALLLKKGVTNVNLEWKSQPRKLKEK